MLITFAAGLALSCSSDPLLWLDCGGRLLLSGREEPATFEDRVSRKQTPLGIAYDFSGASPSIQLPDEPALHLTGSLTVAVWIYPREYTTNAFGSQIFFRGDDRPGFDPYFLRLEGDGRIHFCVENAENIASSVSAPIPLLRWSRITANFDAGKGRMEMWVDGERRDTSPAAIRPMADLDAQSRPAVSIGNVNEGVYNQPFDGLIADLRLYSRSIAPRTAGYRASTLKHLNKAADSDG